MADSGGHWKTLAEAKKLTQSSLIPGVFEEDFKRENPMDRMPVVQAANSGQSIKWNRESTLTEDSVAAVDIGQQLSWSEDVEYITVETELKRIYIQRKLDHFVEAIYGNMQNYKAQVLLEMEKGLKRKVGDKILYADATYGTKEFDGLHAWSAYFQASTGSNLNIDNAEAGLSIRNLRLMCDAMVLGCSELWFPTEIAQKVDEAFEERGLTSLASATANSLVRFTKGLDQWGHPILYFNGIPIVRTDYLKDEEADTGTGSSSDARAAYSSDKQYTVMGIKYGNVLAGEAGCCLAYGGTEGAGDFYKLVTFPELEDYDAGGMRMVSYLAVLASSAPVIARIWDIEDDTVAA